MNSENILVNIDLELALRVAEKIGVTPPEESQNSYDKVSPALSQDNYPHLPDTRKVGVLLHDGFNETEVKEHLDALVSNKLQYEIVSENQQPVKGSEGSEFDIDDSFDTTDAVLYDALYIVGGKVLPKSFIKEAKKFMHKTFDYYKVIGAAQHGIPLLEQEYILNPSRYCDKQLCR